MSNHGEWDRAEAREIGYLHPERCWVLTDRDVWHLNPYFKGEIERHPEDCDYPDEELLITKEMDDGSVRIELAEGKPRDEEVCPVCSVEGCDAPACWDEPEPEPPWGG